MIEFRALGPVDLRDRAGRPLAAVLAQPKRVAILTCLATATSRRRDELIGMFWPDVPEDRARHSLNQALHALRRALGAGAVHTHGDEVSLDPAMVWCDVAAFDAARASGDDACVVDLYRGELLAGFHLTGNADFERWLSLERSRLCAETVSAARRLAAAAERAGNPVGAADWLRRAAVHSPFDEPLAAELIGLLHRLGDRPGALREYRTWATRLRTELDLEPSPATCALVAELFEAAPSDGAGDTAQPTSPDPVATLVTQATSPDPITPVVVTLPVAQPTSAQQATRAVMLRRVALLTGVLAIAAAGALRDRRAAPEPADATRVVVLPFEVHGADAYLGDGLAVLLGTKLDGVGAWRTVDARAVLKYATNADARADGRAAARRFAADRYVTGRVVRTGDAISIHAALHDADGTLRARTTTRAAAETELFALIDEAARALVAGQYRDDATRMARVAALTTSSLPALKEYLAGERAYRGGRFAEATSAFERAALADSTFALAHYRLSLASLWAGVPDTLPFDADARALRHADRLAARDRLLLAAYDAWRRGDAVAAETGYRSIVKLYPDDAESWLQLGETLFHYNPLRGRPLAGARAPFARAAALDTANWNALWHLLLLAASAREWTEFDQLADRLSALKPAPTQALELRALRAFASGERAPAEAALDELRGAHDLVVHDVAWRVAVHVGDLARAGDVARLLTTPGRLPLARRTGHEALAYLALARGQVQAAQREIDAYAALDGTGRGTFELRTFAALLPLAGDARAVEDVAAALDAWRPDFPDHEARRVELTAMLTDALPADTAPHVWFGWAGTSPFRSRTLERFAHADRLARADRAAEAGGLYASFGEHALHDLALLAPSHLRRAELYDRLGDPARAAPHYAAFVELWRDADPRLQTIVADVRQRLRRLTGR